VAAGDRSAPHWVYRSPAMRGLSYRFAVRSDDERLGCQADSLLRSLRDDTSASPVEHWYSLTTSSRNRHVEDVAVDAWRDDELLARDQRPGDALGWIVWDVNRSAAEQSAGDALLLHAGALNVRGAGVLLPGASGSGKSTLVAALAGGRLGLDYLTDELVALDLARGQLVPYPKPITLKAGSFGVLPGLHPDRDASLGARPWDGAQWQVTVGEGTSRRVGRACAPAFVVVPRYDAAATTSLTPLTQTEAFFSVALHAVNLLSLGAAGAVALGALVARCTCYALTVSDLDEACPLVTDRVCELDLPGALAVSAAASEACGG
jgi:hypothetical protein